MRHNDAREGGLLSLWRRLPLVVLLAGGRLLLTTTTARAAALTVTPNPAPAGSQITIRGSGFRPGLPVIAYWAPQKPTQQTLGQAQADQGGNVTITAQVPASAQPGAHEVGAQNPAGDEARTPFTVSAPPSPTPTPSPSPTPPSTTSNPTPPGTTTSKETPTTPTVCWWCWGIKLFFVLILVCVLWQYVIKLRWWTWWWLGLILVVVWVPMLLAVWWGMRQPWWRPWWWAVFGLYGVLVTGVILIGRPVQWWFLPVFWLPWLGWYVYLRGRWLPRWRWWLWPVFVAFAGLVFGWWFWLGPWFWWLFPLLLIPVFLGWLWWVREWTWTLIGPKLCFVLGWGWLPALIFGLVLYCRAL